MLQRACQFEESRKQTLVGRLLSFDDREGAAARPISQLVHGDAVLSDGRVVDGRDFNVGIVNEANDVIGLLFGTFKHSRSDHNDYAVCSAMCSRTFLHQVDAFHDRVSQHTLWSAAVLDVPWQSRENLFTVITRVNGLNQIPFDVFGLRGIAHQPKTDLGVLLVQVLLQPLSHRVAQELERVPDIDVAVVIDDDHVASQRLFNISESRLDEFLNLFASVEIGVIHYDVKWPSSIAQMVLLRRKVSVVRELARKLMNERGALLCALLHSHGVAARWVPVTCGRPTWRVQRVVLETVDIEHAVPVLQPLGHKLLGDVPFGETFITNEDLISSFFAAARLLRPRFISEYLVCLRYCDV